MGSQDGQAKGRQEEEQEAIVFLNQSEKAASVIGAAFLMEGRRTIKPGLMLVRQKPVNDLSILIQK